MGQLAFLLRFHYLFELLKTNPVSSHMSEFIQQKPPELNSETFDALLEERYHQMIAEIEDYAILLLDVNGIIQTWNEGARRIKGYATEEIVGKSFRIFYLPEDREARLPEKLIELARREGKAVHEGWRLRKDGTRFWGSILITALHDTRGNVIGFSKVTRDLSERKIAEDRIAQYASDLEFQNKELEQFAYAASHDLKEPLRKIQFYQTYLADRYGKLYDDKGRDYLNRCVSAARRMQNLIDDILAYTKSSGDPESFELIDLSEVLSELASFHQDEMEQNKMSLAVSKLPVIKGVAYQIRQLFDNLITNSIKYRHPAREGLIKVESKQVNGAEIMLAGIEPQLDYHVISVIDNGTGFDQHHSLKIFEIFQRLHRKTHTSGSGIGLAICKKIVQHHKGFITAWGETDVGARFEIFLPVS